MIDQSAATVAPLAKFPNPIFVVVAALCTRGSLTASLASTHQMPVAPLPSPVYDSQKCLQTQLNVLQGTISPFLFIGDHQFRL